MIKFICELGYGDKVPQTIFGKIIGMIWTMFGICLISVFTASVTTIMGEIIGGGVKEHTIENSVIGVIQGSIERHLVLQNGGKPVGLIK